MDGCMDGWEATASAPAALLRPSAVPAEHPSSRPAPAMVAVRTSAYGAVAWPWQTFPSAADAHAWPLQRWGPHLRTGTVVGSCCPAAGGVCVVGSAPASDWPGACPPVSRVQRR